MARKGTDELKELLLTAIEKQRVQLVEEEGEGTGVEEDLRVLEKWVRKVNVGKADREASKVLKAAGFWVCVCGGILSKGWWPGWNKKAIG